MTAFAELDPASLAVALEETEGAAYADMLWAAPSSWGCTAERSSLGWALFAPTVDRLLFNRVIGCGLGLPAEKGRLHRELDRYRAASLLNFGVQLAPPAQPAELADWLTEEGLAPLDRWTKLYRDLDGAPPYLAGLEVTEATPRDVDAVARITCAAFNWPEALAPIFVNVVGRKNWHHSIAWNDGQPIGAASLFVAGSVAWMGIAGTLPTARRRGAQSALLARRLHLAGRLGCRSAVIETAEETPERPNPSFHNVLRAGFRVGYQRPNWLLPKVPVAA